jgi:hypothetical protein
MKTLYICLLAVLVTACGSKQTTPTPVTLAPSPEKGLAIGTITFEGDVPSNDIYRFFYEATSGDKKFKKANAGKIIISGRTDGKSTFNGDFNDKKTYLFIIEREPGTYAFNQYAYLDHLGPTGAVSSSKLFAIPFEIKKGEITYMGELDYVDLIKKGDIRIYVADYYKRDIPEFKKKFPQAEWDKAINRTPTTGSTADGLIDFRN